MNIEITRGRSDIYDVLTHLTFIFMESHKIKNRILVADEDNVSRDWSKLEEAVLKKEFLTLNEREIAISHTSIILGRSFAEINSIYDRFATEDRPDRFLSVIYWLGKIALEEILENNKRTITFSPILRERLGHHIYGEIWANKIKTELQRLQLLNRPLHIISANMHSVMNTIYAENVLKNKLKGKKTLEVYQELSKIENSDLRALVADRATNEGMLFIPDTSGTN